MGFPDRSRLGRAHLAMERLEDRTTPAKLDAALALALPDLVAAGAVSGDHVNVVMNATSTNATDLAALSATPFAASVSPLGFGIYSVTLTPGTDLGGALAFYGSLAGVTSAAPDQILNVQQTPNDPSYGSLYGMTRIGAPTAWDSSTGTPGFVVAVIDSGVDYRHPDLVNNIWINQAEIPSAVRARLTDVDGDGRITFRDLNNAINQGAGKITDLNGNGYIDGGDILKPVAQGGWADGVDGNGTAGSTNGYTDDLVGWDFANNDNDPLDDNNHGTHVSGTIGAVGNNGVGVAGVNWNVQIMGLKFLGANGSGSLSAAVNALNYAVTMGVKVSNNSWGGGGYDTTLAAAIGRAQTAGHIFVAAAGNSGQNIDSVASYPASYIQQYNNIVSVAATDSNDALASFSNYGASSVTLAAPGVGILSTTPNNTYSSFSGTSMATPHVAGAIALYWGANPTLTYQQVIAKLKSSVDVLSNLNGKVSTGGRLNVAKMFAGSTSPPVAVSGPKVVSSSFGGATATQFDNVLVTFDKAVLASTFTAADVSAFTGPNGTLAVTGVVPVNATNGSATQFRITFAAQTANGSYSLTFGPNITDAAGNLMNQNGNGTNGEATLDRYTAAGTLTTTTTTTFTTGTISVPIRDLSTLSYSFTVVQDVRIADLDVIVNLNHTWDSDLVITLTSPTVNGVAGKTATLFNRRGGSGDNLTNTRFNDEATTSIANGLAPFNGSFIPETALSVFDGLSTKGAWTLTVRDAAAGDVGTLTNWQLVVTGTLGGAGAASALGFLAEEPLTPAADVTPALASAPAAPASPPAAVGAGFTAAPAATLAGAASASTAVASSAPGAAPLWLAGDDSRDEFVARYEGESESSDGDDGYQSSFGILVEDAAAPATGEESAVLYFAPESVGVSNALGALFGDA
ncbi:S8 family serine peptidase [Gemmata sp. JC717]|uniref:S8 family serine peptidase n=1 Tax=Gemmata algarum TaxID=2975278 RepID=UPI0021BAD703|nr:S8 family serine peptidase [Gemmata algarum]MDY3553699.1 S8 family serine peptidase [Gemmata algarum]